MTNNVATYALKAFEDVDLSNVGDSILNVSSTIAITDNATLNISVPTRDIHPSGDKPNSKTADDSSNQQATINVVRGELGNECQRNAEAYFWVMDQPDNASKLIEIELEGEGSDYFTFHASCGRPAVGTDLKAVPKRDFGSEWIDYKSHKCRGRGLSNV